jgi:alkylation response protein AidB-like acyl-CoA dehydrogenase
VSQNRHQLAAARIFFRAAAGTLFQKGCPMQVSGSNALLDLSAGKLPDVARFAEGLQGLNFAQLVVTAGRLDRSREHARKVQASAGQVIGLQPDFLASLADLDTQLTAMFDLVAAEIERRLDARPQQKD